MQYYRTILAGNAAIEENGRLLQVRTEAEDGGVGPTVQPLHVSSSSLITGSLQGRRQVNTDTQ